MTILRQKLIDEIKARGLFRNIKENYVGAVFRLARHCHRAPDQISDDELKPYLLRKRQLAAAGPTGSGRSAFENRNFRPCARAPVKRGDPFFPPPLPLER